jgi:hypothetical protein
LDVDVVNGHSFGVSLVRQNKAYQIAYDIAAEEADCRVEEEMDLGMLNNPV